ELILLDEVLDLLLIERLGALDRLLQHFENGGAADRIRGERRIAARLEGFAKLRDARERLRRPGDGGAEAGLRRFAERGPTFECRDLRAAGAEDRRLVALLCH